MKKIFAFCLCICMALTCLTSCDNTPPKDTTSPNNQNVSIEKKYIIDGDILVSCIGQADKNGKYIVPDEVTMIAESAFAGDSMLKEVVIGPNVKIIGSGAFQYCTALETVTISEGVETIGSHAFANCSSLTNVSLPSTISVLNEFAFSNCSSLESISLEHITKIKESAFITCTSLESVEFSADLDEIGNWAFAQCAALESVSFENVTKLTTLGNYVFAGCAMLRSIDIPAGVRDIGVLTFYDCSRLSSITIPDSVETVDFGAFNYTRWYQDCTDDYLIVGDGVLIKCTVHPSLIDLSGKGIKMIGGTTFYNAVAYSESAEYGYKYAEILENIVIPEGVREIGQSAFEGCLSLKSITLNKDLVRIHNSAFNLLVSSKIARATVNLEDCTKLEYIGNYAFQGCAGIETLELPASVTSIGEYAFAYTQAQNKFLETAAKATEEKDRYWIHGDLLLLAYVADGQTAIHIPDGVKIIAGGAFCGWDSVDIPADTSNLLPSGVSKYNITYKVTEIYLPESVEVIGSMAFFRMANVEKIELPSSLRVIDGSAFYLCSKLSDVTGGENVQEIGDYAFCYCTSLKKITLPDNVTTLGTNVFSGCSALKTVYLPKNMEHSGSTLFDESCSSLMQVYANSAIRPRIYFVLGSIPQSINVDYYK
jgi:hypothetical protein